MIQPFERGRGIALGLALCWALPAAADVAPEPPLPLPAVEPAAPTSYRAAEVTKQTVGVVNEALRGRSLCGDYALRFTLVLRDDGADSVELFARAGGEPRAKRLYSLEFDADGEIELDGVDGEVEQDAELDEGSPRAAVVLRRGERVLVRVGEDVLIDEDVLDDPLRCHTLSFDVDDDDFILRDLEIRETAPPVVDAPDTP